MSGIKEVAEAAGVSTSTVSRVLANKPYVRPEVRERVLAAVARLAYRPNRVARTLRSQQSNSLGLIVSDIRNPFFSELSRAVEDTAYTHGFSVVLCNTDEDPRKEELYLNLMHDENVAGIVLSPTRQQITRFADLNIAIPTVLIDRSLKNGGADAVLLDNVAASYELTSHLLEQGFRRIGAIMAAVSTTGYERERGYADALRDYGLSMEAQLVQHVTPKIETGYTAAMDLLSSDHPPDAILTGNSLLTAGALQAIRERGLHIPDQVALVGFDDTIWASLLQPAITVLAQPIDDIGRTATELLLERIADPGRPARKVVLQGQMRVRASSLRRNV
jgi:LacI family fructose operon transcriptional repressor